MFFYASSSNFEVHKSSILVYQNSESIRNLKDYLNYRFVFLSQSTWFCHGYKRYLSVVSVFRSLWCLESILRSISWLETNLSASRCHGSRYFNLTNHDFHQVCFRYICRFMKCCETRENIFWQALCSVTIIASARGAQRSANESTCIYCFYVSWFNIEKSLTTCVRIHIDFLDL